MKTKKSLLLFLTIVMTLGVFLACGEKKSKEVKVDAAEVEKAAAEVKEEASKREAELKAAKERLEDSLRKVDSLQQVKEHGHVH